MYQGSHWCCGSHALIRAALESAVQLGRGDEVNRQAEMANPTKCSDSLYVATAVLDRCKNALCAMLRPPRRKHVYVPWPFKATHI
jgi:hypothetical protein